jgi:hypothetical protein
MNATAAERGSPSSVVRGSLSISWRSLRRRPDQLDDDLALGPATFDVGEGPRGLVELLTD